MVLARQNLPERPETMTAEVRLLRASLILEECVNELIVKGLGVDIDYHWDPIKRKVEPLLSAVRPMNMIELIDGCADAAVVITGTLSAAGLSDMPFQQEVDENNLAKFGPGHSWREDGKLLKPPEHPQPRLQAILNLMEQGEYDGTEATIEAEQAKIDAAA